jgi:hypothetical protein
MPPWSFRDYIVSSIGFALTRSRSLLRRLLKEHAPDDARHELAERVVTHLEQSGLELDEEGRALYCRRWVRERRQRAYKAVRLGEARGAPARQSGLGRPWRCRGGEPPSVSLPLPASGRTSGPPSRLPACPGMRATPRAS